MIYLKTENGVLKAKLNDLESEAYKLRVVNASFQERLRLVKIAASQEEKKDYPRPDNDGGM